MTKMRSQGDCFGPPWRYDRVRWNGGLRRIRDSHQITFRLSQSAHLRPSAPLARASQGSVSDRGHYQLSPTKLSRCRPSTKLAGTAMIIIGM
jgi:hypothetical protein